MSSLSLANNSGSVDVWKCGNVEICLHCLCLKTLEVLKCGNMFSLSLANNSGSVKCGNVEICFPCICLKTLEVWMCGNVEMCLHCLY